MAPAAAVGNGHRAASSIDVPALTKKERADGNACVLAIGTANPPNVVEQNAYADYYFRVTQSEHMTHLKHKFRRMCDRSRIRKRHMLLTDDLLLKYPALAGYDAASLDARQEIVVPAVPRLGKEAADKAVLEWGQPLSKITHLVFCSMTGMDMPGADYQLIKLMGLSPDVGRVMLYQQGCMAGGTVLRIAKDIAENNRGARVLVVCCEIFASVFRGPRPDGGHVDNLAGQAVFGDGAAALIVGADPDTAAAERALFELLWTAETIAPGSEGAIEGRLTEAGIFFHAARSSGPATGASADADKALANVMKDAASLISGNVEAVLRKAFGKSGMRDWNELFWIVHPGGPAIMDGVQSALRLREEKLRATREVLADYGNMSSCCVLFIMDNMRRWSAEQGCSSTGEGLALGVLLGFGPGLSVETVVLKSLPLC